MEQEERAQHIPKVYYYVTCVFTNPQGNSAVLKGPFAVMSFQQVPIAFTFWTTVNPVTADVLESLARKQLLPSQESFQLATLTALEVTRRQHEQIGKQLLKECQRVGDKIVVLPK